MFFQRPAAVRGDCIPRAGAQIPLPDHLSTGWTADFEPVYPGAMKTEELRRYEEEFRAMREMLGTYYLELGLSPAGAATPDGDSPVGLTTPGGPVARPGEEPASAASAGSERPADP